MRMETLRSLKCHLCFFVLCCTILIGCGRPSHELETAPVSGKVTLDGKPLPQGMVYVISTKGRSAKALIQEDGTFVLSTYGKGDGVQVGTHAATVAALPADEGDARSKKLRVPVPRRYARPATSGLKIEVKAGENNEVEWALSSKVEN